MVGAVRMVIRLPVLIYVQRYGPHAWSSSTEVASRLRSHVVIACGAATGELMHKTLDLMPARTW